MPRKLKPARLDKLPEEARRWIWQEYCRSSMDEIQAGLQSKFRVVVPRSTLGDWLKSRRGQELDAVRAQRELSQILAGAFTDQAAAAGTTPDRLAEMKEALATKFFLAMKKAEVDPIAASRERREWERLELNRQRAGYEKERLELEKQKLADMRKKGEKVAREIERAVAAGVQPDLEKLAAKVREVYEG